MARNDRRISFVMSGVFAASAVAFVFLIDAGGRSRRGLPGWFIIGSLFVVALFFLVNGVREGNRRR